MAELCVTFTVPGKTRGQGRPRFGRGGHAYKDKRDVEWEGHIRECFLDAYPQEMGATMFGCNPVGITVAVYPALPKNTPKKVTSDHKCQKPDVDNIGKAVMDALNGYAYDDDCQVWSLSIDRMPRTRREPYMTVTILGEVGP